MCVNLKFKDGNSIHSSLYTYLCIAICISADGCIFYSSPWLPYWPKQRQILQKRALIATRLVATPSFELDFHWDQTNKMGILNFWVEKWWISEMSYFSNWWKVICFLPNFQGSTIFFMFHAHENQAQMMGWYGCRDTRRDHWVRPSMYYRLISE